MRTVGKIIKEARLKKRYSLSKVQADTKIKKSFLNALEKEQWLTLPEYSTVVGFVKTMAQYLSLNERSLVAVLRRDYPPTKQPINPKPDILNKFFWSPKLTFLVGVGIITIFILGYLGLQYARFIRPPKLELLEPEAEQMIKTKNLTVSGITDPEAVVKVNNQLVLVGEDGKFSTEIEVFEGTGEIVVKASSRSGKETVIARKIKIELNK